MSELDYSSPSSPVAQDDAPTFADYIPLIEKALVFLGGSAKIMGALTSYSQNIDGSLTRVQPFKSVLYLAILSGVSGVFNTMWVTFQLLGGVPSLILDAGSTLVYLLEPSAALLFTVMGFLSGMKFDYTIYLQLFGYVAELTTGISMVLRLVAQDWTGVFSDDTPSTE